MLGQSINEKLLPLHEGSGLFCKPHCFDIQSLYVATSSVTLIILPNMLHVFKEKRGGGSLIWRHEATTNSDPMDWL